MKKNFPVHRRRGVGGGLEKGGGDAAAEGYDIDMTSVLNSAVRQFADEGTEQSAARFGLAKGDQPVAIYRRPLARPEPVGQ
jgi:hypothetical protein